MENEQLLIGMARFFICGWLVFAQPLFDIVKTLHIVVGVNRYIVPNIKLQNELSSIIFNIDIQ